MDDQFGVIDILAILFAMFVVFRLSLVLGRRTGHEKPAPTPDKIEPTPLPTPVSVPAPSKPKHQNNADMDMVSVRLALPDFNEENFLKGAQAAYTMILEAFQKGQLETIKAFISAEIYQEFQQALINQQPGEVLDHVDLKSATLTKAKIHHDHVLATVLFHSEQSSVDDDLIHPVTEIWTFRRAVDSLDPNWMLIETDVVEDA